MGLGGKLAGAAEAGHIDQGAQPSRCTMELVLTAAGSMRRVEGLGEVVPERARGWAPVRPARGMAGAGALAARECRESRRTQQEAVRG